MSIDILSKRIREKAETDFRKEVEPLQKAMISKVSPCRGGRFKRRVPSGEYVDCNALEVIGFAMEELIQNKLPVIKDHAIKAFLEDYERMQARLADLEQKGNE